MFKKLGFIDSDRFQMLAIPETDVFARERLAGSLLPEYDSQNANSLGVSGLYPRGA
jgi:hypothetical protein